MVGSHWHGIYPSKQLSTPLPFNFLWFVAAAHWIAPFRFHFSESTAVGPFGGDVLQVPRTGRHELVSRTASLPRFVNWVPVSVSPPPLLNLTTLTIETFTQREHQYSVLVVIILLLMTNDIVLHELVPSDAGDRCASGTPARRSGNLHWATS